MSTSMTFSGQQNVDGHKHVASHKRRSILGSTQNVLRGWRARYRNRRALRNEFGRASPSWLAHIEQDIGLEPGSLRQEMSKPFWAE
ncbi:hypothetical protein RE428_05140 [Marinobacter nanhaiticus D15-8W]|uniref:hypothetical protein n=1 Tax=Marinobacter nanhaiticus TaxID=1305740 RepID=UPI0002CC6909|nr:hypothetical protein [Marinobacter nanhaiticus]BES69496.1 hypothetical protein RE428_05140 [Marinobacter nanhaiticus D15-8W]